MFQSKLLGFSFSMLRLIHRTELRLYYYNHHPKSSINYMKKLNSHIRISKSLGRWSSLQPFKSLIPLNKMAVRTFASVYHTNPNQMMMDPTCKVAIVIGASKGSGFRAAEELLKAGVVRVIMADSSCHECCNATEKLCTTYGPEKAVFLSGDFCDPKTYVNLFEDTIARFQKVDILFNNLDMFNDNKWGEEVNCNIKSIIRSTLLAHHYMNKKRNKDLRGSVVINCATSHSLDTMSSMPIFCSTKNAIVGFSRSIGDIMHYERTGVRVVALCPSITKEEALSSSESSVQLDNSWGLDMEKLTVKEVQSDFSLGKAVVHLVRYAPSGSVWVLENRNLFYADIPDRSLYNKRGSFMQPTCTPPVLVPRPQCRRSTSYARSYVRVTKLHLYRIKSKNKKNDFINNNSLPREN